MPGKTDKSILYIGGARSGKSSLAQRTAIDSGLPFVYLATGIITDREMAERVEHHRNHRPSHWRTLEVPYGFGECRESFSGNGVLLDCATFLASNVLLREQGKEKPTRDALAGELEWLFNKRERENFLLLVVSNEVGMGVVPDSSLGRVFRDVAGWMNQWLASRCDEAYLVVAGLPWRLKPR